MTVAASKALRVLLLTDENLIPDKPRTHSEVFRALQPGGVFAFSTQHPIDCATSDGGPTAE